MQSLKNSAKSISGQQSQYNMKSPISLASTPINSIVASAKSAKSRISSIKSPNTQSLYNLKDNVSARLSNIAPDSPPIASSSFFNFKSLLFWVFFIIFLAFLGINIFAYLGKGTELLTRILSPITGAIAIITGETTKTTISGTSEGAQTILDKTSKTAQSTIDIVSKGTTGGINVLQDRLKKNSPIIVDPESKNSMIDDDSDDDDNREPEPVKTSSQTSGFCYIGKINDARYCAKVSSNSNCMSGEIYPSMDICINPKLRA